MAAENFKVKKGLEVGTGITANSDGINVTGVITATQYKGDGSGLTGVVASGTGVVVKDEGSAVGTAGTFNFVGSGVAATLSAGTATVTINAGGLDNVVEDTTPELGGNLNLNSKFITGSGGINVTGVVTATTLKGNGDFVDIDVDGQTELDNLNVAGVSTFTQTIKFPDASSGIATSNAPVAIFGTNSDLKIGHDSSNSRIFHNGAGGLLVSTVNSFKVQNAATNHNMITAIPGAEVKLFHNNQLKLTTTINGIEVPDLNVTGVGTVGRLDTNGVVLGTNATTFAAKFADNAVANFGTDNDLKISHDDTHARITNTKGNIVVSGIISATSDVKVGSAITMDPTSGIITATSFSGSAAGLTNIPSAQLTGALPSLDGSALTGITASGSGIIIQHDGSNVGTAGTINFSTNLDVSPVSAGIVTVTASGGGGGSQNLFSTIAVSGQNSVVADATTDTLTFAEGSNITITTNDSTDTITIASEQRTVESIQDIVGNMFTSNTETDITATYQDADGTIDLVVDLSSLNADNLDSGTIPNGRFPATLPAVSGVNLTALNASQITSGTLPIARIADNAVTFAKMQDVGTGVLIGRNDGGSGDMETLSASEVRTLLNVANGATAGGDDPADTDPQVVFDIAGGSGSGYTFTGPGNDGTTGNPDIYLQRGQRYRFINTTGTGHPFEFRNAANTADYTDGITGSQSGTQDFNVQYDAPAQLKYRCTIHTGSMQGNIYIRGANGENTNVGITSFSGAVTATSFTGSIAASNVNSGTLSTDRIPNLAASKITSGTLGTDRIPSLAASKITSGTLGSDRIPDLAASKITSGTFDAARIPTLNQDTTGNAASADTIDVTAASNSANYFVTFVDQEGSGRSLRGDSGIIYNPSSNDLTVSNKLEGVTVKATSELKAGSYSNISSGTVTSSSSTVTVNTTAVGSADMIEYTIYVSNSTNIQSQKVLIMDNGTTAYFQEFATMSNPNLIVSFSADVNSGNVRLIATKESGITGSVSYKFSKMIIQ